MNLAKPLTNCSDAELDPLLARLQTSEFIYEQPATGDAEYTFKHALTQEVAYNSLLIEHRKLLHERIGQAMESLFAERIDDHLKKIAHHYRRSGNNAKAIEYLRRASEQTAAQAFYEEAVEQLNSALELVQKRDPSNARNTQELAIRRALMAPYLAIRMAGSIEIQENSERLIELCKVAGEERLLALVLVHLFLTYRSMMDLEKADKSARQLLDWRSRVPTNIRSSWGISLRGYTPGKKGNISRLDGFWNVPVRLVTKHKPQYLLTPSSRLA